VRALRRTREQRNPRRRRYTWSVPNTARSVPKENVGWKPIVEHAVLCVCRTHVVQKFRGKETRWIIITTIFLSIVTWIIDVRVKPTVENSTACRTVGYRFPRQNQSIPLSYHVLRVQTSNIPVMIEVICIFNATSSTTRLPRRHAHTQRAHHANRRATTTELYDWIIVRKWIMSLVHNT